MKRIFASFAVSCLMLTGCGGKLQSPDFDAVLKAIDITFTPVAGTDTATTSPGGTFRFSAVGLYSTPPGTQASAQTVSCGTSTQPALCTVGQVSGVSWSVDPVTTNMPFASIDANGVATGLRRGTATIRAKVSGVSDATEPLLVSGAVLTSFTITATPGISVPTGRSITLTANPSCSDSGPSPCARDYNYTWSLPSTLPADTVTFSPNPPTGRTIVVRTRRFGAFSIDAAATNEEGTRVQQSINLNATEAILDSISIVPTSGSLPASIALGTPQDFQIRGVLSNDQVVLPVRSTDLLANTKVEWSKEDNSANSRGDITLEDQSAKTSPNSTLRVTGARLGPTNLMARATNNANEPVLTATTQLNGSSGINVIDAALAQVTDICPASAVGDLCPQNVQVPLNASVKFRARGVYSDGVKREVPADRFDWTKTAGTGDVTVDTETANSQLQGQGYTGAVRGPATITATLKPAFRTNVNPIFKSAPVVVVDAICSDELFNGNGSQTTATTAGTTAGAPSSVMNPGNLIDNNPNTFTTFNISASLTNAVLAASINRAAVPVTATTAAPKSIGALFRFSSTNFNPAQQVQIVLLDSAGNTIGQPKNVTATSVTRGTQQLTRVSASATESFTGFRILVQVPNVTAITPISGGMFDPSFLATLQAILGGGGSIQVEADSACVDYR